MEGHHHLITYYGDEAFLYTLFELLPQEEV